MLHIGVIVGIVKWVLCFKVARAHVNLSLILRAVQSKVMSKSSR